MRNKPTAYIPTEEEEQIAFVQWCRLKGIICHHSGNEIGGSTSAMKARAVKMKRLGTSKGFPDLLLFIPILGSTGEPDTYQPLAIEMKRTKGSTTSVEQKKWIEILELTGIPSRICKGAGEAVEFVEEIIKEIEGEND